MTREALAAAEPLTVGAAAPLFATVSTVLALGGATAVALLGGTTSWAGEAVALAVFAAAGAVAIVGSGPFLIPFGRRAHALVLALLLLGTAVDDAAHAAGPAALLDGQSLVVVPLLLLVLAVLRPPTEALCGGLLLAGGATASTLLLDPGGALAPARATATAVAVLVPAVAAAVLAAVALRRLAPDATPDADAAPAVRLLVQQDTVARLEAEATPLLQQVLATGAVSAADAARATGIADRLRAALLADLGRGWLAEAGLDVDDPDGYAERMTPEQRTALRTLLAAVPTSGGRVVVTGQDHEAQLVLELPLQRPPRRRALAPSVALLRAAFASADLDGDPARLRLTTTWGAAR